MGFVHPLGRRLAQAPGSQTSRKRRQGRRLGVAVAASRRRGSASYQVAGIQLRKSDGYPTLKGRQLDEAHSDTRGAGGRPRGHRRDNGRGSPGRRPGVRRSSQVVLVNCSGHGQVRPAGYDPSCMPSSELVTGLKWTSWRSVAFGSGVLKVNDCTRPARRASTSATRSSRSCGGPDRRPGHPGPEVLQPADVDLHGQPPGPPPCRPDLHAAAVRAAVSAGNRCDMSARCQKQSRTQIGSLWRQRVYAGARLRRDPSRSSGLVVMDRATPDH